jgi:hypothetical protein
MTETPETSRQEFEEWAKDKFMSLKIDPEDEEYIWIDTQLAWVAWQASRDKSIEHRKISADDWRDQIQNADLRVARIKCELTAVIKQRDMYQDQADHFLEQWGKAQERMFNAERGLLNSNKREFTLPYINKTINE